MTPKQENFVAEFIDDSSQSAAYSIAYQTENMSQTTISEESSPPRWQPKVPGRIFELGADKEVRRGMQALSREDRVLQELEKIAFGDGPLTGKLKAIELLGKHTGLFKPEEVLEMDGCGVI